MMRSLVRILLVFLAICTSSCRKVEVCSLFDAGGDRRNLDSESFTAIADAGDSLLVGTAGGRVFSFDCSTHEFGHQIACVRSGKMIYQIVPSQDGGFHYSVRDGGIIHVDPFGNQTALSLPGDSARYSYSAYDFFEKSDGGIVAGTSNGVYVWSGDNRTARRIDAFQNDVNASRFYTVEVSSGKNVICAGESGIYRYDESRGDFISTFAPAVLACRHGISLTKDGTLYMGTEKLYGLSSNPIDILVSGDYVYAMSQHSLEIVSLRDKKHFATVSFSKYGTARSINRSSRGCMLKKDRFLYVVPDDGYIYWVPLAEYWSKSETVVQVMSASENRMYLLTSSNALYMYDRHKGKVRLCRRLDSSYEVRIAGCTSRGGLLLNVNGKYYRLSSPWSLFIHPVRRLNSRPEGKMLWDALHGEEFYQGWADNIRCYHIGERSCRFKGVIEAGGELALSEGKTDYYPENMVMLQDGILVNTLHHGLFHYGDSGFTHVPGYDTTAIKDIQPADFKGNGYVVHAGSHLRIHRGGKESTLNLKDVDYDGNTFNRVVPALAGGRLYLYGKGHYGVIEVSMTGTEITHRNIHYYLKIYDAALCPDCVVFATSHGLVLNDMYSDSSHMVPLPESSGWSLYQMRLAAVILSVILAMILTSILVKLFFYRREQRVDVGAEPVEDVSSSGYDNWVNSRYSTQYVRDLWWQMVRNSSNPYELRSNFNIFKSFTKGLDILERIALEHERIMAECRSVVPETPNKSMAELHDEREKFYSGNSARLDEIVEEFRIACLADLQKPEWNRLLNGARKFSMAMKMFVMMYLAGNNTAQGRYIVRSYAIIKKQFVEIMKERMAEGCSHTSDLVSLIALTAYEQIRSAAD